MSLKLNTKYLTGFVSDHELEAIAPQVTAVDAMIRNKSGLGNDFLGWLDLPEKYDREEIARIKEVAAELKKNTDVLIVIGIGGSYLGARAVLEALRGQNYNAEKKDTPDIYFAGNGLDGDWIASLLKICDGKNVAVNVISKSGTTTEPAIAFRIFKKLLEDKYGKDEAKKRIFCTTDKTRGTLHDLAKTEGYRSFVVPDDIGGRYSVLTAVGLLPLAVAGIDIEALLSGALKAQKELTDSDVMKNDCYRYAALRNILSRRGKEIEILVGYNPALTMFNEWFKQLYGESEGKDNKGLYPSSVIFSTDLHSLGQYIQQGRRIVFETVIDIAKPNAEITVEKSAENFDGLNFLAGKTMHEINRQAFYGTLLAHNDGGVPNMVLELPEINESEVGYMIYFFELACAMSGYLLAVNPFNQPGVEEYKKNMFALLSKPGYEEKGDTLRARINN